MKTIVFGGLYWGPLVLANYHLGIIAKKMEMEITIFGLGFTQGFWGLGFRYGVLGPGLGN